ncbi:hypothetical protein PR048_026080 [Dryococelus australis]|uniref:Transposase n=1 Tax=Dryococelus australis TaxID=614101 RepID=A0ABQ9GKE2_9NEOP|nr:hypothetical protein PR048_026080 [Dryococelus australis]
MNEWGKQDIPEKTPRPQRHRPARFPHEKIRERPSRESRPFRPGGRRDLDGNTARLARRSDDALGARVSVARIAPSLLDLGRAAQISPLTLPSFSFSEIERDGFREGRSYRESTTRWYELPAALVSRLFFIHARFSLLLMQYGCRTTQGVSIPSAADFATKSPSVVRHYSGNIRVMESETCECVTIMESTCDAPMHQIVYFVGRSLRYRIETVVRRQLARYKACSFHWPYAHRFGVVWKRDVSPKRTDIKGEVIIYIEPTSRDAVGWCAIDLGCGRLWVRIPGKAWGVVTSDYFSQRVGRRKQRLCRLIASKPPAAVPGSSCSYIIHGAGGERGGKTTCKFVSLGYGTLEWSATGCKRRGGIGNSRNDTNPISGWAMLEFSHVGNLADVTVNLWVFSEFSCFPSSSACHLCLSASFGKWGHGFNEYCRQYGISKPTLKRHLDSKNVIDNDSTKALGRTTTLPLEIENQLVEHVLKLEELLFGVTINDVLKLAYQIAEHNHILQSTHGYQLRRRYNTRGATDCLRLHSLYLVLDMRCTVFESQKLLNYKFTVVHQLLDVDKAAPVQFCEWFLSNIAPEVLQDGYAFFSDEA